MKADGHKRHFVATGYPVKDGKVLLIHHNKLNMWLPPGGHIEENELPEKAVVREIKEETGLDVEILSKICYDELGDTKYCVLPIPHHILLENIGDHQHIDLIFACKVIGGTHSINKDESHDQKWFSKEELDKSDAPNNVKRFGKLILDEFG